jgi:hypothetical protein
LNDSNFKIEESSFEMMTNGYIEEEYSPSQEQPQDIQKQEVALQEIRHEIEQTEPEFE